MDIWGFGLGFGSAGTRGRISPCYTRLERTVVVDDDVLGILVSDPVALCVVREGDALGLETALFHDTFVGC